MILVPFLDGLLFLFGQRKEIFAKKGKRVVDERLTPETRTLNGVQDGCLLQHDFVVFLGDLLAFGNSEKLNEARQLSDLQLVLQQLILLQL